MGQHNLDSRLIIFNSLQVTVDYSIIHCYLSSGIFQINKHPVLKNGHKKI